MKKSTTLFSGLYVSLNDKVVTMIETIGDYDYIKRREFDEESEAEKYYNEIVGN